MLKHKLIACLSILLLALAACGDEPDDDNGNNDTNNTNNANNTNNDNQNGNGQLDYEAFVMTSVQYDNKYFGYMCECSWEEGEFASQEDCEAQALIPEGQAADEASCVQGVMDNAEQAPQSVVDHFECMESNIEASEECFDSLDDTDWCSEDTAMAIEACDAIAYGGEGEDCAVLIDADGEAWLDSLEEPVSQECGE
jgi:hypothetical protein